MSPHSSYIHHLRERAKELACLYAIDKTLHDKSLSLQRICYEIVRALPQGWQYPGICQVQIEMDNQQFSSPGYYHIHNKMEAIVSVDNQKRGAIRVMYTCADYHFLPQEQELLCTVAGWLGNALFQRELKGVFEPKDQQEVKEPEWEWRWRAAQQMANGCRENKWLIHGIFIIGSVREQTAAAESDIDLIVHIADEEQRTVISAFFDGWQWALGAFAPSKNAYNCLLDVKIFTDEDLLNNPSFAALIQEKNASSTRLL